MHGNFGSSMYNKMAFGCFWLIEFIKKAHFLASGVQRAVKSQGLISFIVGFWRHPKVYPSVRVFCCWSHWDYIYSLGRFWTWTSFTSVPVLPKNHPPWFRSFVTRGAWRRDDAIWKRRRKRCFWSLRFTIAGSHRRNCVAVVVVVGLSLLWVCQIWAMIVVPCEEYKPVGEHLGIAEVEVTFDQRGVEGLIRRVKGFNLVNLSESSSPTIQITPKHPPQLV